jgi:hypothetical protein
LLEKASCEHVKFVIRPEFKVSATDINYPSTELLKWKESSIMTSGLLVEGKWQKKLLEMVRERFLFGC